MKSFIKVENQQKGYKEVVDGKETGKVINQYPEMGLADTFARWLIEISSGKQNKYVVCKNWDKTKLKDFEDRSINDLAPDAQDWVFTMVYLCAATKNNASVPSRDEDENTLAKDYDVPSDSRMHKLITFSHRVGLTTLLAEKDKFIAEAKVKFIVDKTRILSPAGCSSFIKEHARSGDPIKVTAYVNGPVLKVTDLECFYTANNDDDHFEATLNDDASVAKEICQLLKVTAPNLKDLGRKQEVSKYEALVRWLANTEE